jgi:hypothetical protein
MATQNHYRTLGVYLEATQAELDAGFRASAKETHPDHHPAERKLEAEKQFKEVYEAYRILSDPRQRREHDREIALATAREQWAGRKHDNRQKGRAEPLDPLSVSVVIVTMEDTLALRRRTQSRPKTQRAARRTRNPSHHQPGPLSDTGLGAAPCFDDVLVASCKVDGNRGKAACSGGGIKAGANRRGRLNGFQTACLSFLFAMAVVPLMMFAVLWATIPSMYRPAETKEEEHPQRPFVWDSAETAAPRSHPASLRDLDSRRAGGTKNMTESKSRLVY